MLRLDAAPTSVPLAQATTLLSGTSRRSVCVRRRERTTQHGSSIDAAMLMVLRLNVVISDPNGSPARARGALNRWPAHAAYALISEVSARCACIHIVGLASL